MAMGVGNTPSEPGWLMVELGGSYRICNELFIAICRYLLLWCLLLAACCLSRLKLLLVAHANR